MMIQLAFPIARLVGRRTACIALAVLLGLLCQTSVVRAAAFSSDDATTKQLLDYLDHDNWKYRLESLGEVGGRRLMPAVDKVVELAKADEHPKVRLAALRVLGLMESSWLVPTAEHVVVEDAEKGNRVEALKILASQAGGSRTAMVLGEVVAVDPASDMRESAARLLRTKKWPGAEAALARAALRDGDSKVRRECRRALAVLGGEEHRAVLHRVLRDEPNKKYRLEIAELLGSAPMKIDKSALLQALDDPYGKVAISAARALVKLGDSSAAKTLRDKALQTTDRKVAAELNEAAAALGG